MQKTNQSFIRAFLKFLQGKLGSNPSYGGVVLSGIDMEEPRYGFKIRLNNHDYILKIYDSHRKNENASYIQLFDPSRPTGKSSIIEYTIDDSNFHIEKDRFVLKQNKAITIGTFQSGLKQESEQMMYKLGFPQDNIILKGDFAHLDFEAITENFFKWLSVRTQTKLTLEETYRNSEGKDLNSVFKKLIERYKSFRRSGDWNELYKWKLVNDFQKNWDIDAKDFVAMFRKIRFDIQGKGILLARSTLIANNDLVKSQPEGFRKCFLMLYDESKPLRERVNYFTNETENLYRKKVKDPSHKAQQEERAIATYLTFRYPDKYAFYMFSKFYKPLCEIAGIPIPEKGERYFDYLTLIEKLCLLIKQDKELLELHEKSMTPDCYHEKNYKILAQDILYRTLSDGYEPNDEDISEENNEQQKETPVMKTKHSPNTILYGPPGTGKTYMTKELAVEIIDGTVSANREELNKRYNELCNSGQIAFVTFHQSMSYEDFVEGIKPVMNDDNKNVNYGIEDGIFKKLCVEAAYDCIVNSVKSEGFRKSASFETVYQSWINDLRNRLEEEGEIEFKTLKRGAPLKIVSVDENDNIVMAWEGKSGEREMYLKRKVGLEKLYNIYESAEAIKRIKDLDGLGLSGQWGYAALFKLLKEHEHNSQADLDNTDKVVPHYQQKRGIVKEYSGELETGKVNFKNRYVLIIDEINRGNIAAILGELITLLEDDKRAGATESLTVTLPYSKENFSVPPNIFIIGTMNTADRSVEALDTALRRRFTFKEMMPEPALFASQQFEDDSFRLTQLLSAINERIELLLDKDHLIGHSFFMEVVSWTDLWNVFEQKIIPQLKEYFYGDYGKIAAILGEGFVKPTIEKKVKLFPVNGTDYSDSEKTLFRFESFVKSNGSFDKDKFSKVIYSLIGQQVEQPQMLTVSNQ